MTYFRVANKEENILETTSVEIAENLNNISVEEIFEMYGVDNEDDLNDIIQYDEMHFDADGHFGAGIYYNGVCCSESLEELASYFNVDTLGTDHLSDSVVFEFEGVHVDSCNDGEVVNPTKVIAKHDISILEGI